MDDIATIKQCTGQVYGPVQVGAASRLLDATHDTANSVEVIHRTDRKLRMAFKAATVKSG
jgi:hypothetical protein